MKNWAKIVVFILVSLSLIVLSFGCAKPAPAPAPAPTPTPSPAPAPQPKPTPAPVSAAEFYKDKTITFLVPTNPGGGFDTVARLVAPWLEKYTGATVVVRNMPGGGLKMAINYLYTKAKPDGLTISMCSEMSTCLAEILGEEGIEYHVTELNWLGSTTVDYSLCFVGADTPYQTAADLQAAEKVKFACAALTGKPAVMAAVVLRKAMGVNLEMTSGYESSKEMTLAVVRGEFDGSVTAYEQALEFIREGQLRGLYVLNAERCPDLPDVPTVYEAVDLSPENKLLIDRVLAFGDAYRNIVAPPDMPKDRVEFLREALKKSFEETKLISNIKKAIGNPKHTDGETVTKIINNFMSMSPEEVNEFKKIVGLE